MSDSIVVINPNSSQAVTDGIDAAMAPLRLSGGPAIDCVTLAEGPPAIETDAEMEAVVQPLCRRIASRKDAGAFVIACFSDPGLALARERTERPVFGIAESAMLTALTLGKRFGIISILEASLPRHLRYLRGLGLESRFAADLPIGVGVAGLAESDAVSNRMIAVGQELRDRHGADVIIMGCAGMAGYRDALERALALPVVEPCQAAAAMALGAVRLNWGGNGGRHAS